MSDEKLPPISFYTRREKTLMGLKLQQSVHLPSAAAKAVQRENLYFHRVQSSAFLPDQVSKANNRKLSKSYRSARESVHRKYNITSRKHDIQTPRSVDHKSHIALHSETVIHRNMPDGIALRRDNSKVVLKVKPTSKPKCSGPSQTTKYAQLHKLGLEDTLSVDSTAPPPSQWTGVPKMARDEVQPLQEASSDSSLMKRNITQTFRVDSKGDKQNCVFPVEFQPVGLPSTYNRNGHTESVRCSDIMQTTGSETFRSSGTDDTPRQIPNANIMAKVELGEELRGVVSSINKSKSENRDMYPIFNWTQQKKEEAMRARFLDPVLKNFDQSNGGNRFHVGFKRTTSDPKGLKARRIYEDITRFVPDKVNIELDWKLIKEYRRRQRHSSVEDPRMPSPSFSPLLNPPPTAMEFSITDLQVLLERERPESSVYVTPSPHPIAPASHSVTAVSPQPAIVQVDTGEPAVNGISCKPVSTALARSIKTKQSEVSTKSGTMPVSTVDEERDLNTVSPNNTKAQGKADDNEIHRKNSGQGQVQQQHQQQKAILPESRDICKETIDEEQPIQVVIKVIPSIVEESFSQELDDKIHVSEEVSPRTVGNRTFYSKPSTAFLVVPRVDVSFEGRCPDKETLPTERKLKSSGVGSFVGSTAGGPSTTRTVVVDAPSLTGEVADHKDFAVQSTRNSKENQLKKQVSSKNIVFISPAVDARVANV